MYRAYIINSDYKNLYTEFDKLRKFFCQNAFGIQLIDECISKKNDSIFQPNPIVHSVLKQIVYCRILFKSNFYNKQLKFDILRLASSRTKM